MTELIPLALGVLGAAAVAAGVTGLRRRHADGAWGSLAAVDPGRPVTLRSDRYRLVGRPDVLRRRSDGLLVPVELKRRPIPPRGPFPSHALQVAAYCLLVEEVTGRAPPFGVLRYDDREVVLPWNARSRAEVLATLRRVRAPYDGDANPSPAKCARCAWSPSCDASLAARR